MSEDTNEAIETEATEEEAAPKKKRRTRRSGTLAVMAEFKDGTLKPLQASGILDDGNPLEPHPVFAAAPELQRYVRDHLPVPEDSEFKGYRQVRFYGIGAGSTKTVHTLDWAE